MLCHAQFCSQQQPQQPTGAACTYLAQPCPALPYTFTPTAHLGDDLERVGGPAAVKAAQALAAPDGGKRVQLRREGQGRRVFVKLLWDKQAEGKSCNSVVSIVPVLPLP